ncbi:MAG: ABC transporter, permease protein [Parcubacteria group bacterium GW2011_GWA2_44_12]|nr:MAG: ABC transporter, permease protein [Parcubacteria group bacterium GW2011_GWA2_44_12]
MKTLDILEETYTALSANKVRSGLTILGIVIGISSVIAMVSIGQGAQTSIQSRIESIGSNLIIVMPGAERGQGFQVNAGRGSARSLTMEDADAIKKINNAKAVSSELSGRYQITSKGKNTNTSVLGATSAYPSVRNVEIDLGSFLTDLQVKSLAKVAVLGHTAREDLFGEGVDPIGHAIRIKGIQFKVIGLTKTKGASGFGSQDDIVFIPLSSAQRFLAGNEYLSSISVQAESAAAMSALQAEITDILLTRHRIVDPQSADFSILNQADIVETASSVTQTFTILLATVAGISLVVGGIGIMNMMLTTVTERTREIGLRKAVGGKRRDIILQFLAEAVMLTFFGGFAGIILGWAVSFGVTRAGLIQTRVSLFSIVLAWGVSGAIGIIFGYYPARKASRLHPIDALRYE